ncbi:MAG: hypothetical protein WCO60_18370 [Verrucomicrobiota bacterium]
MPAQFVFDTRFAEAFLPVEHVVFGKRLLPFCSWHKFQLEIINSPLLLNEPCSIVNLEHAVNICRTTFPQVAHFKAADTWFRRALWFLDKRRYSLHAEIRKFGDYLVNHNSGPKLWDKANEEGGKEPDCDDNLEAVCYFWKHSKCTEREAWMVPLGRMRWYNTLFSRMDGAQVDFWTPKDEEAFAAHVKKREAKIETTAQGYFEAGGVSIEEARERAKTEYWAEVSQRLGKTVRPE